MIRCNSIFVGALLTVWSFAAGFAYAQSATGPAQDVHAADSVIADVGGKTSALRSFGKQLAGAAAQPTSLQVQRKVVADLKQQLKRDPTNPDLNARFESELAKLFDQTSQWCKGYAALENPTREHIRGVRKALESGKGAFYAAASDMTKQADRAANEIAGINSELDEVARKFQETLAAGKELPVDVDSAVVNMDIIAKSIEEDRELNRSRAAANAMSAANLAKADTLFAQAERVLDRSFLLAQKRQRRVSQLAAVRLDRIHEWQLREKIADVAGFVAIGQEFTDGNIDKELGDGGGVAGVSQADLNVLNPTVGKGAEILRARLAGPTTAPSESTSLIQHDGRRNP